LCTLGSAFLADVNSPTRKQNKNATAKTAANRPTSKAFVTTKNLVSIHQTTYFTLKANSSYVNGGYT